MSELKDLNTSNESEELNEQSELGELDNSRRVVERRDFPGRVLLISLLRVLHVIGVVGSGAVLLGARPLAASNVYALVLVGSGMSIVLLDSWANPDYFRQISGLAILLKVLLLATTIWLVGLLTPVFWAVLVGSILISHAPRWLRHRQLFSRKGPP